MVKPPATNAPVDREPRYVSHALVEVKRFRHLPIGVHSAVLLDVSLNGFKIEFTGEVKVQPGKRYWLSIPLSPLGIYGPKRLILHVEIRWFDDSRYRTGGVFMEISKTDKLLIEQALEGLRARGQL